MVRVPTPGVCVCIPGPVRVICSPQHVNMSEEVTACSAPWQPHPALGCAWITFHKPGVNSLKKKKKFQKLSYVLFKNTTGVGRAEKSTFATSLCRNKNSSHVRGPERWFLGITFFLFVTGVALVVNWTVFGGILFLFFSYSPRSWTVLYIFMVWYETTLLARG